MRKRLLPLCALATAFTLISLLKLSAQNTSPYWSLSGNSNTSTSSKLGTTNAIPLRLFTNNKERLHIDTLGRVSIGVNTVTSRFTVNAASGTSPLMAQVAGSTKLYVSSGGGLSIGSGAIAPANGLYVNGTVAVGTTTPAAGYKMHVVGKGRFTYGLVVPNGDIQVTSNLNYALTVKGSKNGIYVRCIDSSLGYPIGVGIGVESIADIGLQGTGYTGVIGYGGVVDYEDAYGKNGVGVYGKGDQAGLKGESLDGTGIIANGWNGVVGQGQDDGVYGSGFTGVRGYGSDVGGSFTTETGDGIHADAGSREGSFAGVFGGNVYASGIFQSSDKNLKQNIKEFSDAMGVIDKLKPKNYEFKSDTKLAALHLPKGTHYGLIAQDVEEVLPNLVTEVRHNLNKPKVLDSAGHVIEPDKKLVTGEQKQKQQMPKSEMFATKAVNYIELIPIMVKGMQELSEKNKEIDALKQEVAELRQMVLEMKNGTNTVTSMSSYLEQNTPNPVSGTTSIRYHVPQTTTAARLDITNAKGQLIKTVTLNNRNIGQVNLSTSAFAAGTYNYTLYIDSKPVDTKRLVIAR